MGAPTRPPEASASSASLDNRGATWAASIRTTATGTRYYVKWPGEERARAERLANELYWLAGTSVASTHLIDYTDPSGQGGSGVAIASTWLDGSAPMTASAMRAHPGVRAGFLADAWLANWDVVGLDADNIVSTPEGHAVRIDAGGAMMYRGPRSAQAVPQRQRGEFNTLRDRNISPQGAPVFEDMKPEELARSAAMLASVTDDDIDGAVVKAYGNAASEYYPPQIVARLRQRRDVVIGMAAQR